MVSAVVTQECETDYDVSYRELASLSVERDVNSKDRFAANARFRRSGRRRNLVNGAHRRRDKRNYL